MVDKNLVRKCMGCDGEGEKVKFKLTVKDSTEELYCAECMSHVFESEPECIMKVEAI